MSRIGLYLVAFLSKKTDCFSAQCVKPIQLLSKPIIMDKATITKEFLTKYSNFGSHLEPKEFDTLAKELNIKRIFVSKKHFEIMLFSDTFTFSHLMSHHLTLGEKVIIQIYPHHCNKSHNPKAVRWVTAIKPIIPLLQDDVIYQISLSTINSASL